MTVYSFQSNLMKGKKNLNALNYLSCKILANFLTKISFAAAYTTAPRHGSSKLSTSQPTEHIFGVHFKNLFM